MNLSESVQKIFGRDEIVADFFYTRFLDQYPEVQRFFEGVDLKDQALVLMMTLLIIDQYHHHKYIATERYLKLLGRRHQAMNIPADLFPLFRNCLLETLERFHGNDWEEQLCAEWQTAIDQVVEVMLTGYDDQWIH